jgi:hypothetical protein
VLRKPPRATVGTTTIRFDPELPRGRRFRRNERGGDFRAGGRRRVRFGSQERTSRMYAARQGTPLEGLHPIGTTGHPTRKGEERWRRTRTRRGSTSQPRAERR